MDIRNPESSNSNVSQDQKLRNALQDYENEKWRIVAGRVGTGFTPVACRERAEQLATAGVDDYTIDTMPQVSSATTENTEPSALYPQGLSPDVHHHERLDIHHHERI